MDPVGRRPMTEDQNHPSSYPDCWSRARFPSGFASLQPSPEATLTTYLRPPLRRGAASRYLPVGLILSLGVSPGGSTKENHEMQALVMEVSTLLVQPGKGKRPRLRRALGLSNSQG
jgi:hypothetical protein